MPEHCLRLVQLLDRLPNPLGHVIIGLSRCPAHTGLVPAHGLQLPDQNPAATMNQQNVKVSSSVFLAQVCRPRKLWELRSLHGGGVRRLVEVITEVELGQDEHGLLAGISQCLKIGQDVTLSRVISDVAFLDSSWRGLWV